MPLANLYNRFVDRNKPETSAESSLVYLPDDEGEMLDTDALVIQPPFASHRQKHMGYIAVVGADPNDLLTNGLLYDQSSPTPLGDDNDLRVVELPMDRRGALGMLYDLEYADLILFVIDTRQKLSSDHLRWFSRMQEFEIPVVVLLDNANTMPKSYMPRLLAAAEQRLHVPVIPVYKNNFPASRELLVKRLIHRSPRLAAMLSLHAPLLRPILVKHLLTGAALTSLGLDPDTANDEELSSLGEAQMRLARQIKAVYGKGARLSRQEYQSLLTTATAVTHYTSRIISGLPTRSRDRRARLANAVSTLLIGYMTMVYHGETPPDIRKEILPHIWRLYRASGQIATL